MAAQTQAALRAGASRPPSIQDLAQDFDRAYQGWAGQLTESEKSALVIYRTPGQYYGINYLARNGELPKQHARFSSLTEEKIRDELIPALDSAIAKAPPLKEAAQVYRAMVLPEGLACLNGALRGKVLDEPAFMSSTLNRQTAVQFEIRGRRHSQPPVLIELELPAGTRAAYIESSLQRNPKYPDRPFNEQELLIGRGYQLQFTSNVELRDGVQTVRARLVDPAGGKQVGRPPPETSSEVGAADTFGDTVPGAVTPSKLVLLTGDTTRATPASPTSRDLFQTGSPRLLGGSPPPAIPADLTSSWDLRRFDDESVLELSYQTHGHVTAEGAEAIRSFVEGLSPTSEELVLFRGQDQVGTRVSHLPEDPESRDRKIADLVAGAQAYLKQRLESHLHHQALSYAVGSQDSFDKETRRFEEAGALDAVSRIHKETSGSPLLVSATRSLSVAAGDYNMRRTDNRHRYIVILVAPKEQLLNVDAAGMHRHRALFGDKPLLPSNLNYPREQEISVWADATPYVAGIFDAVENRFLSREEIEQRQAA